MEEEIEYAEDKLSKTTDLVSWWWTENLDFWEIILYMGYGFFDSGKSFDKGMDMLMQDDYFEYLSSKTMKFLNDFENTAMKDYDFVGT